MGNLSKVHHRISFSFVVSSICNHTRDNTILLSGFWNLRKKETEKQRTPLFYNQEQTALFFWIQKRLKRFFNISIEWTVCCAVPCHQCKLNQRLDATNFMRQKPQTQIVLFVCYGMVWYGIVWVCMRVYVCMYLCLCVWADVSAFFLMVFIFKHRFYLGFDGFSANNFYRFKPIETVFLVTNSESHISTECNIIILIRFSLWSCIHCQWVCNFNFNFIFIIWAFHDTWIIQL